MSEKKRTTVTTIVTHEVWIVRRTGLDGSEIEVLAPDRIEPPQPIRPFRELHDVIETNELSKEQEA